ncbi:MAG TPA: hypothetical protein VLY04_24695 [Bryobacteraceae bacterium]|nr:hypothetical protein [Bryobacteraceae bacterium]
MSSLKQIEANRLNAQKSTGPRSVEGKAAVRMNALKSGIDAQSAIIRGENPADLETLTNEYLAAHSPVTPQERFYVDILIRSDWQMRRLTRADAQIWEYQYDSFSRMPADCPLGKIYVCTDRTFARLQRRMKDIERSYKDAAQELKRLQSDGVGGTDDRLVSSVDSGPADQPAPPSPDSAPSPQPLATEPTPPQIGFVPSMGSNLNKPAPNPIDIAKVAQPVPRAGALQLEPLPVLRISKQPNR